MDITLNDAITLLFDDIRLNKLGYYLEHEFPEKIDYQLALLPYPRAEIETKIREFFTRKQNAKAQVSTAPDFTLAQRAKITLEILINFNYTAFTSTLAEIHTQSYLDDIHQKLLEITDFLAYSKDNHFLSRAHLCHECAVVVHRLNFRGAELEELAATFEHVLTFNRALLKKQVEINFTVARILTLTPQTVESNLTRNQKRKANTCYRMQQLLTKRFQEKWELTRAVALLEHRQDKLGLKNLCILTVCLATMLYTLDHKPEQECLSLYGVQGCKIIRQHQTLIRFLWDRIRFLDNLFTPEQAWQIVWAKEEPIFLTPKQAETAVDDLCMLFS